MSEKDTEQMDAKSDDGRETCPDCARRVGTYENGKIRPHYSTKSGGMCPGTYCRATA